MLESMIKNPIPTRAEVTDIYEAVMQKADCTMLSGETAGGDFPFKSTEAMTEVIIETENNLFKNWKFRETEVKGSRAQFSKMTAKIANDCKTISAIVVITRSGFMANLVSNFRPRVPIFAFTNTPSARRRMQILWGVKGFKIEFSQTPQKTIKRASNKFLEQYPEFKGKEYVLISDFLVDNEFVPTLQIRKF